MRPPIHTHIVCSIYTLGTAIVMFFRCMNALLNPVNRTIKWPLAVHTVAMFLFVTVDTALNLGILSICYIDNRGFLGNDRLPPGPAAYQFFIYSDAISVVPNFMFVLNTWLADGLLVSSVSTSTAQVSYVDRRPALSLLCYLCHGPLGYHPPLPNVPRLCGYVLWFAAG